MEGSSRQDRKPKEAPKQPYKKFKDSTDSIKGYWWDEERLTILPEIESKPEEIELPVCDCEVALTYVPATSVTKNQGEVDLPSQQNPDAPPLDIEVSLHALYEPGPKIKGAPHVITKGLSFEQELMAKLTEYAPLIDGSGKVKNSSADTLRHARSELVKHLNHIPFLNGDRVRYWEFAVEAYEKYKLANLMEFIIEEGKKKKWVGDAHGRPGWSILSFKGLVQLAHMYPPIRDSGAKLSFKVVQLPCGYYLREILLSLTRDMQPAKRPRALLTYQNSTGKAQVGKEYGELMDFSANLLFKDDKGKKVKILLDN